jgi:hypothetical protein
VGSWPVGIRVVWVDIIVYFFVIMRAITIIYLFFYYYYILLLEHLHQISILLISILNLNKK